MKMTNETERWDNRGAVRASRLNAFASRGSFASASGRKGGSARLQLGFLLALAVNLCGAGERGVPAQDGILNFGKVSDRLYRSAQPDAAAIRNLKQLEVKSIVNLRMPGDSWKDEETEARANGILYTNIPMSGIGRPEEDQIRKVLALFETLPAPILVHCQHGCDRTGTVVACYRIAHDRWSGELALKEAERYGLSKFEFGMRRYILDFGHQITPEGK